MMFKRKNRRLSQYPACDHLNAALMQLLKNPKENRIAIQEIQWAITKSGGYFYGCVISDIERLRKDGIL